MCPLRVRSIYCLLITILTIAPAFAQQAKAKRRRIDPPVDNGRQTQATPFEQIKVKKDFRVELLYSVPRTQGSWVAMCLDPQGRLIVSDQGEQGLFRVTPPPVGNALRGVPSEVHVEPLNVKISGAQGLLWAFDSLYVMNNNNRETCGLYRCRDTDGDGELDTVETLRILPGGGGD